MTIEIGEIVGDYQVLAALGAGGVGRVYKVRHTITGRIEALKVLLPDYEQDVQQAERFLREVKVQANLSHPNIASVHNAFRYKGSLLMVMELVEGESLDKLVARGRLPLAHALDLASQALSALAYAHSCGVVHRDVKPENLLVTPSGTLKVTDFGLAKTATDVRLTVTGATIGSLYYISPEQVNGVTDLDERADIYSMGVVLYELVTGRRPFEGAQPFHLMLAHVEQPPKPPAELEPSLPPALNDVILRALQKRPEARFASAQELQSALDAAVSQTAAAVDNPAENAAGKALTGSFRVGAPSRDRQEQERGRRHDDSSRVDTKMSKVKRLLLGLSFTALLVSMGAFFTWRALRPDPSQTVAVPSGNHRLLRKVIPDGAVQAVVFNAGYSLAAVLTADGVVEVWEPESGERRARFSGADARSKALALSPDGNSVVFTARNSGLRLWDVASGEKQLQFEAGRDVRSVAISADGSLLAAASDRGVTVWDTNPARGEEPVHRQESEARMVTFKPDGVDVVIAGKHAVDVHRLGDSSDPMRFSMPEGAPAALAFNIPKNLLAAAGGKHLHVWSSSTHEPVYSSTLPGQALALGFTRSGQCVALSSSGGAAQIWNAAEDTEVSGFLHGYDVSAAALSPDGRLAATATTAGDLWFWKADPGWDPPPVPISREPQQADDAQSEPSRGKGRKKNVFRRFVDIFRK